jgi:rhodanese-related sulfurtransferase
VPNPLTPRRPRHLLAAVLLLGGLTVLSACGGDESSSSGAPAAGRASAEAALEQDAVVIDVRTPEEYDAGHIEGAQLLDIQSASFAAGVEQLDPEQTYVVYCRSGNRSATATDQMEAAGLTVLDGGAMGDMVAAGWAEA